MKQTETSPTVNGVLLILQGKTLSSRPGEEKTTTLPHFSWKEISRSIDFFKNRVNAVWMAWWRCIHKLYSVEAFLTVFLRMTELLF